MIRILSTVVGLLLAGSALAQVSLSSSGMPYRQNFDTLPAAGNVTWTNNTTIPGWYHARTGNGTTVVADNGGNNAGNLYSYGTTAVAERALGSLGSGNAAVGNLFWGVRLQNNTGSTITSLHVSYVGEQWRNSAAAAQTVSFSYLVGTPFVTGSLAEFQSAGVAVAALNFTSPITGGTAGALDGNAPANRVVISHTITGLNIPANVEVMLRWSDPDHAGADHGLAIDDFSVSACNTVCFNGGGLSIPVVGVATPYPSTINVAGLAGDIVDVTVRLNGYTHSFPRDVDVLLVAPNGQRSIVMSDAGGGFPGISNVDIGFNDAAAAPLGTGVAPVSGTIYQPTDWELGDSFPAPAPAGPHPTGFAAFYGPAAAQNGAWQLYVLDDTNLDSGSIGSWALEFTLATDLSVTLADNPDPVLAGNNLSYTAVATNAGALVAQDVTLTLPIPAGTSFVSATPSIGGVCMGPNPVICSWSGATAPSAERSAVIVVLVAPSTLGTVNATLTGSTTTPDSNAGNNTAVQTTTVNASADMSITLADAPDPVTAGNNLTYTAVATNGGPSDAQEVSITLPLPAGTSFVSATPSAGGVCNAGSPVVCNWAGATAPSATRTATIVALVAPATTGPLDATATAASTTSDPVPGNNSASNTTGVIASADMSITLADAPDPVNAGSNLTYTAVATNGGPSNAQDVSITLPLPAGTSFVSATPSAGGVCNAVSPVVCNWAGATAPAGARTATIVALVAPATTGPLEATATAASTTSDPVPGNNSASNTTGVVASADLSITLADAPDPVNAGSNLTYTAVATNGGPSDAQDVSITLPLPAGTSFVSATPSAGGVCNAVSPVVCNWAGVTTSSASRTATIVALVAPATTGPLEATATAASTTSDPVPGNNSASNTTGVVASADLSIALADAPDPVIAGSNLTYTAVATNGGPSNAQDVSITLPLPAGTSFVSATPSAGGVCNAASPVVCNWAGATAPAATRTVAIVALVAASVANGTILNATATVASTTSDPVGADNTATAQTTVNAQANLSMTLTDSPDPVGAGANLTYTATVIQGGPSDAQTVAFSLPLPVGTSLVSATPSAGGACAGAATVTCTWAGATAPGVNRSATIVVLVAANVLNGTVLSATATATSATTDPVPGNNSATTTTTVNAFANLELTLTASTPNAALGQVVTFTAISTNLGPSDAQDVQIVLTLSPDFRFSSHSPSAGAVCTTPQIGQSGAITCTWAGATAAGAARTLEVNAISNSPGTSSVQASTSSPTADPVTANNTASTAVLVGNPVEAIPLLDRYGLILLGLLIGMLGMIAIRTRE